MTVALKGGKDSEKGTKQQQTKGVPDSRMEEWRKTVITRV